MRSRAPDPEDGPGADGGVPEVDLHGLRPPEAQRLLERELHAARVRGASGLLVITGRGWGNEGHVPVLRKRMAVWLRGPEGRSRGVKEVTVTAKGGALFVRLG